jgi:hypothetical protein
MNYILIGLIVILVILIAFIINKNKNIEKFSDKNIYLSQEETLKFIDRDEDKYIQNLSIYDIYARKSTTNAQYKLKAMNACNNFNNEQKIKLDKCSATAKNFFDNKHQWKFSLVDEDYEEGFPHTRKDIIFLSPKVVNYDDTELIKLLIHESVHISQRYDKEFLNKYLEKHKYTISRRRDTEPMIRANPDLDEFIYMDASGIEMLYKYKSVKPKGINDIIPSKNEHPFEVMAYEIAENYIKFKLSKYKYI